MRSLTTYTSSLLCLTLLLFLLSVSTVPAQELNYPETRMVDQIDDYHGTSVADPYRWLEDINAPEVKEWVRSRMSSPSATSKTNRRREVELPGEWRGCLIISGYIFPFAKADASSGWRTADSRIIRCLRE
jgi:hypothetical protein